MENKVHVDSWFSSLIKKNEELCGDKVVCRLNEESMMLVLADGLGSGVKANILSTLTSTIISEMLFSGATLDETVDTIVKTLPVCKERDVAYSTFTIIQVYYDGRARCIEFDNPEVILYRDGKCLSLERKAKVISDKMIYESDFEIYPDDFLITFSDGIVHAGLGTSLSFGWQHKGVEAFLCKEITKDDPAKKVVHRLLDHANGLYEGLPGDDSTVACLKIIRAKETRVMVGPPSNKADDENVVNWLMGASGLKICCGGTTSTIVSRVLNEKLEIEPLLMLNMELPPKGSIKGIDLVTEGVLTLQMVNRTLEKCISSQDFLEKLMASKEKDGATCLCKAFLKDSSKICFGVGLSDNPGHEAIAYSTISLNAKIKLIEDMADNLRKLRKIVVIRMV